MVLDFHLATFSVPFIWSTPGQQSVATLFATQYVYEVGRVYVALFGSPHSIPSDMQDEKYMGRTPSDANGLYRILHESREPTEAEVRPNRLSSEADYSAERQADMAARILEGVSNPLPLRTYDVLAKPYALVRNHALINEVGERVPYDLIVVGAAIWAGTPASHPDPTLSGLVDHVRVRLWPVLDALNGDFTQAVRRGDRPAIPDEVLTDDPEQSAAVAAWFVHLGKHLGRLPRQLLACQAPSRLNPLRYVDRTWRERYDPKPTGQDGFVVRVDDQDVLVTESGDAIPVRVHPGGETVYAPDGDDKWLAPGETPIAVPQETLPRVRAAMWLQAAKWRLTAHLGD